MKYILDNDENPVLEPDILKWGEWYETADRQVADTKIDGVRISTVFLGIDHAFGSGDPVLYETMIFGGEHNEYQERCGNKVAAIGMHDRAVAMVHDAEHPAATT